MEELIIKQEGVFELLLSLDEKKSSGPEICSEFLKRYAEWISYYLTVISETSLKTHSLPLDWRRSVVTPVYKGSDRRFVNNYRPILLTCITKFWSRSSQNTFNNFLNWTTYILIPAWLPSCNIDQYTIIEVVRDIAASLDNEQQIHVIGINFAKASDKMTHDKLIFKLQEIGVGGTLVTWIKNTWVMEHRQYA